MLPLFRDPNQVPEAQSGLQTLNAWRAWVDSAALPPHMKQDVNKLIETFRFIRVNQDQILQFVNNKATYLAQLPDRDRNNAVIRDHCGTSLHFNSYDNGDQAQQALMRMVGLFEETFLKMQRDNDGLGLLLLASQFKYDQNVGCMEARVDTALQFVSDYHQSPTNSLPLMKLFAMFQNMVPPDLTDQALFDAACLFFTPYFERSVSYNNQEQPLTRDLINNAFKEYLLLLGGRSEPDTPLSFADLTQTATYQIGRAGMHQFRFKSEEHASALQSWLIKQPSLAPHQIHKCQVQREGDEYVVRLTNAQYARVLQAPTAARPPTATRVAPTPPYTKQEGVDREALMLASHCSATPAFHALVRDADRAVINRALSLRNTMWTTPLHVAASSKDDDVFTILVDKADKPSLSEALTLQNSEGWTPLHVAAQSQSCEALKALVGKANADSLDRALRLPNHNGLTPLHIVVQSRSDEVLNALLLREGDQKSDNPALYIQNNDGLTPLHMAVRCQSVEKLKALLEHFDPKIVGHALTLQQDHTGLTPLHLAAQYQSDDAFTSLVVSADPSKLGEALGFTANENSWTPLHMAARYRSSAAFTTLVKRVDQLSLGKALTSPSKNLWTPLHTAARHQSSDAFMALLESADRQSINRALIIKGSGNLTPLHLAAQYQSSDAFMALLESADQSSVSSALIIQNDDCLTPLCIAVQKHSVEALQALLKKADTLSFNQALMICDHTYQTPLHIAAHRSIDVLKALLARAEPDIISKALVQTNGNKQTPLHIVARYQSVEALQALLEKIDDPASVSHALTLQDKDGQTPLHMAARYQSSEALKVLLEKIDDPASVSHALTLQDKDGRTPLHMAARYQSSEALKVLLDKADQKSVNDALIIPDQKGRTPLHLVAQYQDAETFNVLLETLEPAVIIQALQASADNHALLFRTITYYLTFKKYDALSAILSTLPATALMCLQTPLVDQRMLWGMLQAHLEMSPMSQSLQKIETLLTPPLLNEFRPAPPLPERLDECLTHIHTHGLESWKQFYVLTERLKNTPHPALAAQLNRMSRYKTLSPVPDEEHLSDVFATQQAGLLAMKTFTGWQPQAWPEFLTQLKDPTKRASLRKKTASEGTHKFHHLTGEITGYHGKKPRPKEKHQTHAKKQSATLISQSCNTPLFQSQNLNMPLVGVAMCVDGDLDTAHYDPNKAKIRAMLLVDSGTFQREWRGSEAQVRGYQETLGNQNFTKLPAFQAEIAKNATNRTNEVLLEPSQGSLMAIFIGRDTPEARKLALQYQRDIKEKLHRDLPIISYDPLKKELHAMDLTLLVDQQHKLLEKAVTNTSQRMRLFFTPISQYKGQSYPATVVNELREIDQRIEQLLAQPATTPQVSSGRGS